MTTTARISRPYDYDDFCARVADGEKGDLIDGAIFMASPDNTEANDIFLWLGGLLYDYVEQRDLGRVFGSRVACKLDKHNTPEPDILFVPRTKKKNILRGRIDGPPALAVEIVSPESIERDYFEKRGQYERFGVREYWIIDEMERRALFLRLGADGKLREAAPRGGIYRSKVVKGFRLRLDWLWPETRPKKLRALTDVLHNRK